MKLSNNYIVEGFMLKKGANVLVEYDDKYNNMITDDNGESINNDAFEQKCESIISQLDISPDNATQIKKDVIDFCKGEWVKYHSLPSVDKVKNYLVGRNQTFATN